jgi:succinate dehydrogenase / fumarate reductase cytochrome b subunit
MVAVGLHLSHGFYSAFASLGVYHPKFSPCLSRFGFLYAVIVALGFMAPPVYVLLFMN